MPPSSQADCAGQEICHADIAAAAGKAIRCAFHIIDPSFPLIGNDGYFPPAFTIGDYRARTAGLGIRGGAVVSGSFQGFDQGYLRESLARLGPGFVGVTQLPSTTSDAEIRDLDAAGIRASGSISIAVGPRPSTN